MRNAMRTLLLLTPVFAALPLFAQSEVKMSAAAADQPPPNKMLYSYLRAEAQKHFDARHAAIAALKTPQDVEKRQKVLKAKFIESLGGFPAKTPLNPQIVGTLKGQGYRIERIIYESRPNHHVTANLYLPDGPGPFPGVILPLGHYANGKANDEVQRAGMLLATNGIAVLAFDPIGQGERRQLLDAKGKPAIGSSTTEHTLTGVGALLVGENTATYRIWDGIRSLDYLASRPEIDPSRLGCTGCSGGGTLTSYLMALDDRIACAAPSCYLTTLARLLDTIGPQDAEQNITGQIAFGMDHVDYILMRAPRPTLMCAATKDFFDIQGAWTTFREAAQLYALMGQPERVAIVEANTGHGYSKQHREAVVRWMSRWLLGKESTAVEPNFTIARDEALQCTRSGQVQEDFHGKSVFHLNADRATELAKQRTQQFAKRNPAELFAAVREVIALPKEIPAARLVDAGKIERPNYVVHKGAFAIEPGITVPAMWFKPNGAGEKRRLILYVNGDGSAAQSGPGGAIDKLVQNGDEVLALDLRGLGETAPGKSAKKAGPLGNDANEAFLGLHLNRPLLGQRVVDLLAVVRQVETQQSGAKRQLHVIGVGSAAPVVLHAAALEPALQSVALEGCVISWTNVAQTPLTVNQLTNVVPGALKTYDLPDLAAALAPRPLTLSKVANARGELASQSDVDAAYASARAAYQQHQAGAKLIVEGAGK
jgi:dienelactone hydrolase